MLRLYRQPEAGEFFVVFLDGAQGGRDSNFAQFLSKSRLDVPLALQVKDVMANTTPLIHQALEWLFDRTKVQPVVAFERNMGGSSEMERLRLMNRLNKYRIYTAKKAGTVTGEQPTELLGWNTDTSTRPKMIGDLKQAIDSMQLKLYDEETIDQLRKFIVNKRNKPEAAPNAHDDAVMSLAGAWQLYQTENPVSRPRRNSSSGNLTKLWY